MMPVLIDAQTGGYAVLAATLSTVVVVVIRWLFNTRREYRADKSGKRADEAEETAVEILEKVAARLQMRLDSAQTRIEYLEGVVARRDLLIENLQTQLAEWRKAKP